MIFFNYTDRFDLQELLSLVKQHDQGISRLDREIAERLHPDEELIERLDAIPGCSRRIVEVLLAEIGSDMSPFPDAAHLASWVGICPGNNESGGKRKSGRIRKGNRWIKAMLVQAANAAARTKNSYLSAQYHQIAARRGNKRAVVAVAHSILVIYYHMVTTGEPYQEKGATYFSELDRKHAERRATRQLERLGYRVTLTPLRPLDPASRMLTCGSGYLGSLDPQGGCFCLFLQLFQRNSLSLWPFQAFPRTTTLPSAVCAPS